MPTSQFTAADILILIALAMLFLVVLIYVIYRINSIRTLEKDSQELNITLEVGFAKLGGWQEKIEEKIDDHANKLQMHAFEIEQMKKCKN